MKIDYKCPHCQGKIKKLYQLYECENCKSSFEELNEIPIFAKNKDFYYGEIPEPQMDILLEETLNVGWEKAFSNLLCRQIDKKEMLLKYVLDEGRAAWKFLLNINSDSIILDYGCGWGSTSVSLAKNSKQVVATDLTFKRLNFLKERAKSINCNNITFVCAGDTEFLPFDSNFFDVIILNGVLEWVPLSFAGPPNLAQRNFLKEIKRVLKPTGQILIAIENRVAFRYFLGFPDEHTGLRYVSLLPRVIANIYSRLALHKKYMTYTYSMFGYNRLLKSIGFKNVRYYYPRPDYRFFSTIIDLTQNVDVADITLGYRPNLKRMVTYFMLSLPVIKKLFKFFVHSYIIFAFKQEKINVQDNFINKISNKSIRGSHIKCNCEFKMSKFYITHTNVAIFSVYKENEPLRIFKLPLDSFSLERLENQHIILKTLINDKVVSPNLLSLIPFSFKDEENGQKIFVEKFLEGIAANKIYLNLKRINKISDFATNFITDFHLTTETPVVISEPILDKLLSELFSDIQTNVTEEVYMGLHSIKKYLQRFLLGQKIPLVWNHGDFWLGNILVDKHNLSITGILDWDLSSAEYFPLLDIFNLLVNNRILIKRISWFEAVLDMFFPLKMSTVEKALLDIYIHRLNIPEKNVPVLGIIYCIDVIKNRLKYSPELQKEFELVPKIFNNIDCYLQRLEKNAYYKIGIQATFRLTIFNQLVSFVCFWLTFD